MSAETKPNGTATAAPLHPSPEVVNGLLKWPEQLRLDLASLLLDSVKEGFTSLEDVEHQDRETIRGRIEAYERGEMKAADWRAALARVEDQFRAEFPQ